MYLLFQLQSSPGDRKRPNVVDLGKSDSYELLWEPLEVPAHSTYPFPETGLTRYQALTALSMQISLSLQGPSPEGVACAAGEGISAEDNGPNAMFKLSALKGSQAAGRVGEAAAPDEEDAAAEPASSEDSEAARGSDVDSDEAQRWDLSPPYTLATPDSDPAAPD